MNETLPPCPECSSAYTYEMGDLLVCPECAHEWVPGESSEPDSEASATTVVKDAVGNLLADGDSVSIVKSLKVKGSPQGLKVGTKARNIRLVTAADGHDIEAKVDGFGIMKLKSSVVKKI